MEMQSQLCPFRISSFFSSFETQEKYYKNDSKENTGVYVNEVKHTCNRKNENTIKK